MQPSELNPILNELSASERKTILERMKHDNIEIYLGYKLVEAMSRDILSIIQEVRCDIAEKSGVIIPLVRVRDDIELDANDYTLKIKGFPIDLGTIKMDKGHPMTESIESFKKQLQAILESNLIIFMNWENAYHLIKTCGIDHPHLVESLLSKVSVGFMRQVFQRLLENGYRLIDVPFILETIEEKASEVKDPLVMAGAIKERNRVLDIRLQENLLK